MQEVDLNGLKVGGSNPCALIAEIGINANGDTSVARSLIEIAALSGWSGVKLQKRHISMDNTGCYKSSYLKENRQSPWGNTQLHQKRNLEFTKGQFKLLVDVAADNGIYCYASVWDKPSVDFLENINMPAYKIPSAVLTDMDLLRYIRSTNKPIVLSTGMHTDTEIDEAVEVFYDNVPMVLLYCVTVYPCPVDNIDLTEMIKLGYNYPDCAVGYSGHEPGLTPSIMAWNMGAAMIERHVTIDRHIYGSDQKAAIEEEDMVMLSCLTKEHKMPWPRSAFDCQEKELCAAELESREKFRYAMNGLK